VAAVPTVTPAGRLVSLPAKSAPEGVAADPTTHKVVVALRNPDRVAIVDTKSLRVRIIAAPGKARHLVLAALGGPVLLPAEDKDTLSEIALPSGRVTRTTAVLKQPHNAAVIGPNIWVADELSAAVSIIGASGKVIATVHGPVQPGGIVTAAGTVGVTDVRGARMYFFDATTLAAEGSIALGTGPTHAVAVGGSLALAADTRGGALLLIDMATRRVIDRLAVPGGPYGMASDPATGKAWVTVTEFNKLVEVSVHDQRIHEVSTTPTVQQPNTVAENPATGCTYVAGVSEAVLEVICPKHPS
jgi:DNA-binding beta-propeller fold protein YncE